MSKPDYYSKEHFSEALTWIERNTPGGIRLVAQALSETGDVPPPSNCDGCARGVPISQNIHRGPGGPWDIQFCTRDRYVPEGVTPEEAARHPYKPGQACDLFVKPNKPDGDCLWCQRPKKWHNGV